MSYYVPGADERDPKKVIWSLQQVHERTTNNTDDIATNATNIATNTTNIATNTANIATNTASIAAHESAWTAYTPTLGALAGTYTTSSAAGRYKAIGKTIHVHVTITITTVGTGTFPLFTLPVAALNYDHAVFYGTERGLTGKSLVGRYNGSSNIVVTDYNSANIAASGAIFELISVYEAA